MATRSWRSSLYKRAALFLVLGCGSILGAVVVLSSALVEESVDRLLDERLDLAQTTGILLEQWPGLTWPIWLAKRCR